MSTQYLNNRNRTYLSGDWESDADLLYQLVQWNEEGNWGLSFIHVQDEMEPLSNCLYCTIKRLLEEQMSVSKSFVLIVGKRTKRLRDGSCGRCKEHVKSMITSKRFKCRHEKDYDIRGYVQYECDLARKRYDLGKIKIIILYNFDSILLDYCPESLIEVGVHLPVYTRNEFGTLDWNYEAIKNALETINL
jgi:hypothetical protein